MHIPFVGMYVCMYVLIILLLLFNNLVSEGSRLQTSAEVVDDHP